MPLPQHADVLVRPEDYVNHSLYLEAKTFLHGLLVVEDKLSMAHSLESRVPFLDNDLVDFAMRLPVGLQARQSRRGGAPERERARTPRRRDISRSTSDGKLLLRKVLGRYVGAEVMEREKQGFSAPDASWFRGESIDYVRDRLLSPSARIYDWMDHGTVAGLIEEHLSGRRNRRLLIWSLLYVEEWSRQFLGAQAQQTRAAAHAVA